MFYHYVKWEVLILVLTATSSRQQKQTVIILALYDQIVQQMQLMVHNRRKPRVP